MLKKIFILFLIFTYTSSNILNIALFERAFGAGISLSLQQVSLDISASFTNPSTVLSVLPNQEFRFESLLQNNEAVSVTNVSYYTNFPSDIIYSGTTRAATQVNGAATFVIPITSYNPPNLPNYINGLSSLSAGSIYAMKRNILKFPLTHSGYENTLSSYFTANNGALISNTKNTTIYVNVRPHIVDYYFSKSSLVTNGTDSVDLYVKVKDYNGCSNLDTSKVIADMSELGLSSTFEILYDGCDTDQKTATFKYAGLTTLSTIGDKVFSGADFSIADEDNNINTPNDSNTSFDDEDKKTDIILTVASPVAPVLTLQSNTRDILSSISPYDTTDFSFSADMGGQYKVVLNGNGTCSNGTILQDWTAYATGNTVLQTVLSSSMIDGENTVYACVKNFTSDIGSLNINVQKDTQAPTIYGLHVTPATVVTNNATGSLYCSESGQYRFGVNGNYTSYRSIDKDVKVEENISNAWLNLGENFLYGYCKDAVGNVSSTSVSLTKEALPPSMTSSGLALIDNDIGWDGVDGRDIKITFDNSIGSNYSGFGAYMFYLLPQGVSFTGVSIGNTTDKYATSWVGNKDILNDSLGNPLSSGNYDVYVAILGQSLNLGGSAMGTGALLSDVVPHPEILQASFTSPTNLQVKFNTPLKVGTGSHFATGFSYQVGGQTFSGISIRNVSNDIIDVEIQDLLSTSSTGILTVATGSVWGVPVDGSFNFGTGNIYISDKISPLITFSTGTISPYNGFYSGSIDFQYTTSEKLVGGGYTKIDFTRVGGNSESTTKSYFNIASNKLFSGSYIESIDLSSLGLVSGAYYDVKFIAQDIADNISSVTISNIKYDKNGPGIPTITPFGPNKVLGVVAPNFVWISSTDDNGNGSGVKGYTLRIFEGGSVYGTWNSCTGSFTDYNHTDLGSLTKSITLANNNNYAWGVLAYDNIGNIGSLSNCDNFYIDTNIPNFSLGSIKDNVLNSTTYAKGGNSLTIKATITNSNSGNIYLNATSLKDSSYANISCQSPVSGVTCTYSSNIATYNFSAGALGNLSSGIKQVQFTAANASGINTGTYLVSTTLDNTAPNMTAPLTAPISGTYGGTGINITWNPASITDNIGISSIKLDYFDGSAWNFISTGANAGMYPWNISGLTSGNNYQIRITAYDAVGLSQSATGGVFIIDKIAPVVASNAITYPSASGVKLKGGQIANITWNPVLVTDAGGLASNPITLMYSSDGGTNYTQIASNLANNGSYAWNVPASVNSTSYKIKLIALDNVGNTAFDVSDNNFEIDSSSPSITLSYAGNGGSTPVSNSFINNSGFDISASISDNNLSGGSVYYSFFNQTTNQYYNGSVFSGSSEIWNYLATASGSIYNLASTINPIIVNGQYYKLKIKADDIVGNTLSTSQITYVGDTTLPTIAISTASGTYFSGSINILGTASDIGAGVSSVKISIKKGTLYWDGAAWVPTEQILATNSLNSYANWNYNFSVSGLENDGQNYQVIAYAYDRGFKVNNSSFTSIGIVLDKQGPSIESNIFTFATGGLYSGGDILNITWNISRLSDSGVGLIVNPVNLEFYNGTTWETIANNIANNGTYNYVLPMVDTSVGKVRMNSQDSLGNISSYVLSHSLSVDSTDPSIVSVETKGDTLGGTNGIIIKMSEKILNPGSLNIPSIFSVSGVTLSSSYLQSEIANQTILELSFTPSYTGTSITPIVYYNANIVSDLAGRKLQAGSIQSVDTAEPRIISAQVFDTNTNGKIDKIQVIFSENISSTSDITAFSLNNALAGMNIISSSVSGNMANIILSESSSYNTDSSGMTLNFTANSNWKDSGNNIAGSLGVPISLQDRAIPVLLSALLTDNNSDYIADKVVLNFSENLTGTMTGFSLSSGSILTTNSVGGNTIELGVFGILGTSPNINFSYSGSISDNSSNLMSSISNVLLTEKIPPKLLSGVTQDINGNGKIDSVVLLLSEGLNGNFSDLQVGISTFSLAATGTYSLSGVQMVKVSLDEKNTFDTGDTPTITISANNMLSDTNGNIVSTGQTTTAIDGVGPVIIGARFDEVSANMYLDFSENVNALSNASFVLSGASSSISSTTFNSGTSQALLHLTGTGINYGTSEISLAANTVSDMIGNKQNGLYFTKVSGSVIINEVMVSGSVKYIELKNISSASVDISGYVIENALGNGSDYTIGAFQTLGAGGYYLIASTNASFSGITANQMASVNVNSNLALKSGSILLDSFVYSAGVSNKSFERIDGCGNGLSSLCWSQAVASNGFVVNTIKGTPKTINILDTTNPNVGVNISDNEMLPIGNYTIKYTFGDNIEVNTGSVVSTFLKWNGSSFVTQSGYSTGSLTATGIDYSISGIPYGKYKTTFMISDTSGNQSSIEKVFYIDNFTFQISTGSIDLGILQKNVQKLASQNVIVTVSTLGAGFQIDHSYTGTTFPDYTGTGGYGACLGSSCTTLESFKSKNIITQAGELQSSGALKNYTYEIKYGALQDGLLSPGNYIISNKYNIGVNY